MNATVGRRGGGQFAPVRKNKRLNKIHPCANCAFLSAIAGTAVDVISKSENSLEYIGRQVNSLTGLSSLIFLLSPSEDNCCA